MKYILSTLIVFFLFAWQTIYAQQSQWDAAAEAYAQKNYQKSVEIYDSLFSYGVSADLYYNYANALYKVGDLGPAILNYERALVLDPSHEDAHFNLDFLNTQISDKIESIHPFFLISWMKDLEGIFTSNIWAYISITLFILFLCMALLYLFSNIRVVRKSAFFIAIFLFTFFIVAFVYSFSSKRSYEERAYAIVMSGSVSVKSSPDYSGTEIFVLHEGTKLKIVSSLGEWCEVKIADGNSGWMPIADIERI